MRSDRQRHGNPNGEPSPPASATWAAIISCAAWLVCNHGIYLVKLKIGKIWISHEYQSASRNVTQFLECLAKFLRVAGFVRIRTGCLNSHESSYGFFRRI
jgi:hypothetical protein